MKKKKRTKAESNPPKPQDPIATAILRLVSPLKSIAMQTPDSIVFVRPEDIAFLTSDDKGILIVDRGGGEWRRFDNLTAMEERLKEDPRFFRSHRSFIVNLFAVYSLTKEKGTDFYEIGFKGVKKTASLALSKKTEFGILMALNPLPNR